MKEARAAGTRSSAGAMARNRGVGQGAGPGFPRLQAPPPAPPPAWDPAQEGEAPARRCPGFRPPSAVSPTRQQGPCTRPSGTCSPRVTEGILEFRVRGEKGSDSAATHVGRIAAQLVFPSKMKTVLLLQDSCGNRALGSHFSLTALARKHNQSQRLQSLG